jgi:hypothetical protein
MKRKGLRLPHNTIRIDSKSELTYATQYHHSAGDEYQTYAMDANGKLVHAGVSRHTAMDETTAWQIQRLWERWRNEYDNLPENVARDYPAKNCPRVTSIMVFPIDSPKLAQTFYRN